MLFRKKILMNTHKNTEFDFDKKLNLEINKNITGYLKYKLHYLKTIFFLKLRKFLFFSHY